ncbi:NADH dehydrogenase [ubiquinone] 1 alpha subcomplex subunit 2-like [Mytilus galloprovincialis]|uniref:NADH dehydrogenase [ubiquinone] 1 alpha subcomplex subunit 2 n=1 Tax=Mytilus galloprovincialis TaxID=29158 RepID=A0A8B6D4K7_MYTGA|nr:NADH dehydrogenase (ubiquinone) 1 alpha subcomplex subunit 2 [Mytilus galloprovincialis]
MASAKALRFGQSLKELRIHLCQKSTASQGVREFIENYYVGVKQSNPKFPILIRECSGVQPKVYARYEFGKEHSLPLSNMTKDQVLDALKTLSQRS